MKNKLNKSFFYLCVNVTFLSVLIVGIVMITITNKFQRESIYKEISNAGKYYINELKSEYDKGYSIYSPEIKSLNEKFNNIHNMDFLIYNENGECILSFNDSYKFLSDETRKKMEQNIYLEFNSNQVSESKPYLIYGEGFQLGENHEYSEKYFLIVYLKDDSIEDLSKKLVAIFVLLSMSIYAICLVIFHFLSKRIGKPVSDISRVLEKFSKGDFSERINSNNYKEIKDIVESINNMADFISDNEEISKSFIANVSHELRTPMTTINGFVDGILDGTIPEEEHIKYLNLVSEEIKRLKTLVTSMLNMTKFENGKLSPNFSETNITDLIIKTAFLFERKITDKNVDIQGLDSERVKIVMDSGLIEQVIYNLVENAVKFVNENGVISFSVRVIDKFCYVDIRNTGEGLTEKELSKVFDRFYKADSSRGKDTTGLGIGLAISKKIIGLHNGQIMVKSVLGEYTEFTFKIPLKQN